MRIELVPGMTNVVRFPIELRVKPSMDLLREISPDPREVDLAAEAFDFEQPFGVREDTDKAMAEHILNHVRPEPSPERIVELDKLLGPLVVDAVEACKLADRAADALVAANRLLVRAQAEGSYWIAPLEEDATRRANEAARLLIEAYVASEEAEGAARAIQIAKNGEVWTPRDHHAEMDAMCAAEMAARAGRSSGS